MVESGSEIGLLMYKRDYRHLLSRFYVNKVSDRSFNDTVCIVSKNSEFDKFNWNKLENSNEPIALSKGIHNSFEASDASNLSSALIIFLIAAAPLIYSRC